MAGKTHQARSLPAPDNLLDFWFQELTPAQWWRKDEALDQRIARQFMADYEAARAGELFGWRASARGRLAEILLLDQIPRHLFRGRGEAFATDSMALILAQEAVLGGADRELPAAERAFLYMPYMHSESRRIHDEAVRLFEQPGLEDNYRFELRHKAIIDRFGRYPHRNKALGRTSTPDELAFLRQPGSSF